MFGGARLVGADGVRKRRQWTVSWEESDRGLLFLFFCFGGGGTSSWNERWNPLCCEGKTLVSVSPALRKLISSNEAAVTKSHWWNIFACYGNNAFINNLGANVVLCLCFVRWWRMSNRNRWIKSKTASNSSRNPVFKLGFAPTPSYPDYVISVST
jgi:hypothetical protein